MPTSVGASSTRKSQSSSSPLHASAGKLHDMALQSPEMLEGTGHRYSQPVESMEPFAGLWR